MACSSPTALAADPVGPQPGGAETASSPAADQKPGDQTPGDTLPAAADTSWHVEIEPRLWYSVFRGDITLAHGNTFDVSDVNMDEPHVSPAGSATIRSGPWSFMFDGSGLSFDGTGEAEKAIRGENFTIAAGARARFDVDYDAFMLSGGYSFDPIVQSRDGATRLWFDAFAGAALYHLDFQFGPANAPGGASESSTWVEPLVGGRMHLTLPYGFEIACTLDAGVALGPGSGFAYDIMPTVRWFVMDNRKVAVEVGFRHRHADLSSGDNSAFEFDATQAGVFAGVVVRF